MQERYLYIFLDESGDFNFTTGGSRYFLLTSVAKERPFEAFKSLHDLRYDLLERGVDVAEFFHATEDKQIVRDGVFEIIKNNLSGIRIDSLIVEKAKTCPSLRELEEFYPRMLGYLLRYVLKGYKLSDYAEVLVFLASLHTGKQKRAVQKAIKKNLSKMLPPESKYRIIYQSAKCNFDIQIADYCTWAIFKKWASQEYRPYKMIMRAVHSEFDIFQNGTTLYY
jgi:hypothetical protein